MALERFCWKRVTGLAVWSVCHGLPSNGALPKLFLNCSSLPRRRRALVSTQL